MKNQTPVLQRKATERGYILSHVTVRRIKQLGLDIYEVTRFLTKPISLALPPVPTLAISPEFTH
jgi:hypothetical protein